MRSFSQSNATVGPNHSVTIILLILLTQLSICSAQSLSLSDYTWEGRTFNKETAIGSPYDSLVQLNQFTWNDDTTGRKEFFEKLADLYPVGLSMERIVDKNRVVYRFVIRESRGGFSILEKAQSPNYMEIYFKNGMAVHEIRFYKQLVPFFRDSYD